MVNCKAGSLVKEREKRKAKVIERVCPWCGGVRVYRKTEEVMLHVVSGTVGRDLDMYHCRKCKKRSFLFAE